jgi:hypothetical protein
MKTVPRDQWGNVCVPRLELLPDFDRSGRDAYQWLSVPRIT